MKLSICIKPREEDNLIHFVSQVCFHKKELDDIDPENIISLNPVSYGGEVRLSYSPNDRECSVPASSEIDLCYKGSLEKRNGKSERNFEMRVIGRNVSFFFFVIAQQIDTICLMVKTIQKTMTSCRSVNPSAVEKEFITVYVVVVTQSGTNPYPLYY